MTVRFDVSFNDLLVKVLEKGASHYITRLPTSLLSPYQVEVQNFLEECSKEGFCPDVELFRQKFTLIHSPVNLPLDVIYENFTIAARDEYFAKKTLELFEKNAKEKKSETDGLYDYLIELQKKTAIPNPKIISYKDLDRRLYQTDIISMEWHVPYFDDMTDKLVGGDFVVLMASTKTGKTTLLKVAAQGAYDNGETVMFCSQEQGVLKMTQQLDLQRLGMMHNSLRHGVDEETATKLDSLQKRTKVRPNNIYITPQVKSVAQLREWVESCEVRPTKIFIDGLNLMQSVHTENSYSSLAQTCAELKEYANESNIAIITVTQTNRGGAKAGGSVDATHMAGSFAIAMFADFVIAMSPLEETHNGVKMRHVYIRAILNRHGGANEVKIRMTPLYDKDAGTFQVMFAELDPNWSPESANITYAAKQQFISRFEEETGMSFSELNEETQKAVIALGNMVDETM